MMKTKLRRAVLKALLNLPPRLLRRVVGPAQTNDRGDLLELQTQALLYLSEKGGIPRLHTLPVAEARAQTVEDASLVGGKLLVMANVTDLLAGDVPARHYDPGTGAKSPLLLFAHGGGFVVGDLDSHDRFCRRIAVEAGCHVLALHYGLAPERPFPAATDDVLSAWRWARENAEKLGCDADRIVIGGDSAGGNLATVTCLRAQEEGLPMPMGQLLIYPGIDMTCQATSHQTLGKGYFLESEMIDFFVGHYLGEQDPTHVHASPSFTPSCAGLPPAVVVTCGFDPLRDEGDAWAERLAREGVPTRHRCEPGLVHGYINMDGLVDEAAQANVRLADDLQALFAGTVT